MDENEDVDRFFEPSEAISGKPAAPVLIYHTTYKNLGRNIDEKVRLLAGYMDRRAAPAFLFELARHDPEKGVGSYWVKDSQAPDKKEWLSKPVYYKKNGLDYRPGLQERLAVATFS